MTAFKYNMKSKFAYCSKCWIRINRVYQREYKTGVFKGFGYFCNHCNEFTHDNEIISYDNVKENLKDTEFII